MVWGGVWVGGFAVWDSCFEFFLVGGGWDVWVVYPGGLAGWRRFFFREGGLGVVTASEFRVLRIHDFGVEGLFGFQEYGSEPRCFLGE